MVDRVVQRLWVELDCLHLQRQIKFPRIQGDWPEYGQARRNVVSVEGI